MRLMFWRYAKLTAATFLMAAVVAPAATAFDPYAQNRADIDSPGRLVTTKKRLKIELTFRSNFPDSTFGCSLEKGPNIGGGPTKSLKPCSSPATYTVKLKDLGKKLKRTTLLFFWVRATSPSEKDLPTPDPQYEAFKIVRKAETPK